MKTTIVLNEMRFYAYHGVMEQETKVGNQYSVNITMEADLLQACESDNVEDTINYANVFNLVKEEMNKPSKLIEHVAMRIYKRVKETFPAILKLDVRVVKWSPPVRGEIKSAEIVISD